MASLISKLTNEERRKERLHIWDGIFMYVAKYASCLLKLIKTKITQELKVIGYEKKKNEQEWG